MVLELYLWGVDLEEGPFLTGEGPSLTGEVLSKAGRVWWSEKAGRRQRARPHLWSACSVVVRSC